MKPFRLNKHGKLVLPCSIFIDIDFTIIKNLDHLQAIVRRDFEGKAPTGTEIAKRATAGSYATRYDLLRDISLNLFWANRFALTMYDKRPTRWRDVPRNREDIFVALLQPWTDGKAKAATVRDAYDKLDAKWSKTSEDDLFEMLFDVFSNKLYRAQELPPIKATIAEALATPNAMTTTIGKFNPDYLHYSDVEILDASEDQPELEALRRWAMVLHNQAPWDRSRAKLKTFDEMEDDDVVVLFYPKNRDVLDFINRVKSGSMPTLKSPKAAPSCAPVTPLLPLVLATDTPIRPKIEALAIRKGEVICNNDDVVRNSPPSWSPMSADEITEKTGIERRRYTAEPLENIALEAAQAAMKHAGRSPG